MRLCTQESIVRSIFVCIETHIFKFTLRIYLLVAPSDLTCPITGCGKSYSGTRLDNFQRHIRQHEVKTEEEERQCEDIVCKYKEEKKKRKGKVKEEDFREHKPQKGKRKAQSPSPSPSPNDQDTDNTGNTGRKKKKGKK